MADAGRVVSFRLPPLNAVRLFEAAGRHQSFKRAAEELSLTPGAISHAMQGLESWLGTPLFERRSRGLSLTPAGSQYLAAVSPALGDLSAATELVPGRRTRGAVAISASPSFGIRWLMPRLGCFAAAYPEVAVTIDTSRDTVELPATGFDLAIRRSETARPGGRWISLMREAAVPVCAPRLRAAWADPLTEAPRLLVTVVREDWSAWPARVAGPPDIRMDCMHLALEAAAEGLGVTLGYRPIADDALAAGRLVALSDPPRRTGCSYWLVGSEDAFERPEVRLFRRWLLAEIGIRQMGSGRPIVPSGQIVPGANGAIIPV